MAHKMSPKVDRWPTVNCFHEVVVAEKRIVEMKRKEMKIKIVGGNAEEIEIRRKIAAGRFVTTSEMI